MAKHDIDPVLHELVKSVNESGRAAVPVTVAAHGTVLTGSLIAQDRYFAELVEGNPLMSALEPTSGLLGKEYTKDVADAGRPPPAPAGRPDHRRRSRGRPVADQPAGR